jgi:hypothetical protein
MKATIKLRSGNLFDRPADLVALPCSRNGSVTSFVARALVHHSIPCPSARMELGDVTILPFEGGENIAQYVCFAASVSRDGSTLEAIEAIGKKLGRFSREQRSVRALSVPLLGTGAGGLSAQDAMDALRQGFLGEADPAAVLTLYVLDKDLYERLRVGRARQRMPREPIRVFISHTSKDPDAANWVKGLAQFLIEQGIQARLDLLHLRHGMDLPQWMCNELELAKRVIVVCDEAYKAKAEGRVGGVGWETMIIQGDLSKLPWNSTKYQVVVRSRELSEGLPHFLRTKFAFHVPGSKNEASFRANLVAELLNVLPDPEPRPRSAGLGRGRQHL